MLEGGLSLDVGDIPGMRKPGKQGCEAEQKMMLEQRAWTEESFRSTVASKYLPPANPTPSISWGTAGLEDCRKLQRAWSLVASCH